MFRITYSMVAGMFVVGCGGQLEEATTTSPASATPIDGVIAEASSSYHPYYSPEKMVDGSASTFWVGGIRTRPWTVTYNLGANHEIDTLEIDWYYRYGSSNFDVEVSADGTTWTTLHAGQAAQGTTSYPYISTSSFDISQLGTYVRLVIHEEVTYFPVITEARIYGTAAPVVSTPNVMVLIDTSASMSWGYVMTYCPAYSGAAPSELNKSEMVKAALTGCVTGSDGFFDRWSDSANFAIVGSGYYAAPRSRVLSPFGSDLADLEAAAMGTGTSGGSSMPDGLRLAGSFMGMSFADPHADPASPNIVIAITDGFQSPYVATYDFACDGGAPVVLAGGNYAPAAGAAYLADNDILCSVAGDQPIRTYVIAIGPPGSYNANELLSVALAGDGQLHLALDSGQINNGLDLIMSEL